MSNQFAVRKLDGLLAPAINCEGFNRLVLEMGEVWNLVPALNTAGMWGYYALYCYATT